MLDIGAVLPKMLKSLDRKAVASAADGALERSSTRDAVSKTANEVLGRDQLKLGGSLRRMPTDGLAKSAGQRSLLASAQTEASAPGAFVLSAQNADFRKALGQTIDPKRQQFITALQGNRDIMSKFDSWESLTPTDKVATLKQVADLQGQVMGFTPPPILTKAGVPKDGMLGFFAPDERGGLGSVTVFPAAMAKTDKWTPLVTITHEMQHAHQDQIVKAAANGAIKEGTPESILARGFANADQGIEKVGGEDNLTYGDYAHLNNEFDSFRFGNSVGTVISKGEADTSGLGFVDAQFDTTGKPLVDLEQLAAQVGPNNLLDAVNQKEEAYIKSLQTRTA